MAHLFQKFYRVDNSETREIGGTGLGLYLCRRLAEAMNGRIWAESQYKQGSTFYLELPRVTHEDAMRLIEEASVQQEKQDTLTPIVQQPELAPPPEPIPEEQPSPSPNEGAYTTPSVDTVVEQLQSIIPTQSPPRPPSAPQVQPPTQYAAPQAPIFPQNPNTPLSSIEQNPGQYMRARGDGVTIPPRNQNQA